jgi:uncharacterized cofD-like protein
MRVVGIGGGTGLPVLLRGLKHLNDSGEGPIDITAIVAVSDSGGSTGALRRAFGMPAVGDIRNCILSLASADPILASVCNHRFDSADHLAGHSLGNLILTGLYQMTGDFGEAVRRACALLRVQGRVLPATEIPLTLCALREDGTTAHGEYNVPKPGVRVTRMWTEPLRPAPGPAILQSLAEADVIVMGPGSLYTSVIPNLLVAGVREAIHNSRAVKVYVCNLMTQPGETDGYSAVDHIQALQSYLPPESIDVCILNNETIGMRRATRYHRSGAEIVVATPEMEEQIRNMGIIPASASLLKDGESKARHDPVALARVMVSIAQAAARLTTSFTGNGRGGNTCAESSDISVPEKSLAF